MPYRKIIAVCSEIATRLQSGAPWSSTQTVSSLRRFVAGLSPRSSDFDPSRSMWDIQWMKCLWDRFCPNRSIPPPPPPPFKLYSTLHPHLHVAGSIPKGNALSEIGNHSTFKNVHLVFKGLRKPYTYGKFAAHNWQRVTINMQYTYSPNHVTYHEPSVCLQKYITSGRTSRWETTSWTCSLPQSQNHALSIECCASWL
jgi:hypothetical protein